MMLDCENTGQPSLKPSIALEHNYNIKKMELATALDTWQKNKREFVLEARII